MSDTATAPASDPVAADAKTEAPKAPEPNPMDAVKFPPLDNLGAHFYDNEAGTFWIGINLRNDPMVNALTLDGVKLPMLQASLDFRAREQRRNSLITRVKESAAGMKESLEQMLGRVGVGKKAIVTR